EARALAEAVQLRRRARELERSGGAVNAAHRLGAGARADHRERPGVAVKVEDAHALRQARHAPARLGDVEGPARFLAAEHVDEKSRAAILDLDRPIDAAAEDPDLVFQPLERAPGAVVPQYDGLRRKRSIERLEESRQQALGTGGVGLHHRDAG